MVGTWDESFVEAIFLIKISKSDGFFLHLELVLSDFINLLNVGNWLLKSGGTTYIQRHHQ